MMTTRELYGVRIVPEIVALYQRAREIYDQPLSTDPEARHRRQVQFYAAQLDLHAALNRSPEQVDIFETVGDDTPPLPVTLAGNAAVQDWMQAVAIRVRLEALDASGVNERRS